MQFLDNIPESVYHNRPFGGRFRTFAWEFACIFTTREMYIRGCSVGKLDGNTEQSDEKYIESLSRAELKKKLEETSVQIRKVITGEQKEINYFGDVWKTGEVISYLLQHEQLHFGKLMLMCAQANVPMPVLLKGMWGQGSFSRKDEKTK